MFLLLSSACIIFWKISLIQAQFNMTAYDKMPPLYKFEDYDSCLNYNKKVISTYCMVYAEIIPNETSALWTQIEQFSSDKRHYRHDRLFFGVCLEHCKSLLKPVTLFRIKELYGGKVSDKEIASYYFDIHKRDSDNRIRYERLIGSCLNYRFQHEYQLQLRTEIEYCERNDVDLKHDTLDIAAYVVFVTIMMLSILSTTFDLQLKRKQPLSQQNNNFYKTSLEGTVLQMLTSFSLYRNYYRLMQEPKDQTAVDLKFFDAFRVIGMFLVIFAHALMLFMSAQIVNPAFFEQFFYRAETAILENGAAIIQIFFVMSGFLLYTKFAEKQLVTPNTSVKTCVGVYFKLFIYRYLRLMPSLVMLMLFNATILTRLQDGPFWRHFTEGERTFCREYWWKNVFFVNNYLMLESCAHQTWYIAADMQLFEFFLLILIIISKYPKLKRLTFYILLILAISTTAFVTYFFKLNAIYHSNPENYRYLYFKDAATFYKAYTPFYTNIGGYLFGAFCADIFAKRKRDGHSQYRGNLKYELCWWLILPAAFGLLFTGAFFMSYDFEISSLWVALYAGFYRNLWVVLGSCALLGMCFKLGWVAYEFARVSFFRPLAKVSYQAFLWHVTVLRLIGGHYRQPFFVDRFYLICYILVAILLTQIVAFIATLFIEIPASEMVKCCLYKFQDANMVRKENKNVFNLRRNICISDVN